MIPFSSEDRAFLCDSITGIRSNYDSYGFSEKRLLKFISPYTKGIKHTRTHDIKKKEKRKENFDSTTQCTVPY